MTSEGRLISFASSASSPVRWSNKRDSSGTNPIFALTKRLFAGGHPQQLNAS